MATQQVYQAYAQNNKGTLVPGQTISVNKYTVQVERYLSQGGFAHVYLVRTPAPVYGTTHHVLKRIAVANEAMLSEVKKEVDVMRLLKGHPNIVHLIDAAWHRMPNGMYEVFILMEFCPGGGIIDMMNRRLRERLTEAEILQIFVDVCEGVAFMHNSRPALLHRDLKVENILQSSPTSYKLCDFGSASTVSRPPTNTQEIRAVEADIGRHTTMQYRAPEMIDLYSKRPIDEKSDVWALGVLLYKLCYYTTPFEEHGSLAILNVQYRIPPYPVYSSQMNMLIASMLREHGTQRPTVFEVLNHVHYLRGTKSQFTYNIPATQPLPPRQPQKSSSQSQQTQPQPTNAYAAIPPYNNNNGNKPRDALPPTSNGTPPSNAGVQAREKVLEAIAPMRRGRPANSRSEQSSSRPPSPQKSTTPLPGAAPTPPTKPQSTNWLDNEEAAWKTMSAQAKAREKANALFGDAWKVSGAAPAGKKDGEPTRQGTMGFGDDFAEKLWRTSNPNASTAAPPKSAQDTSTLLKPSSIKPLSHTGNDHSFRGGPSTSQKDAFEGLGLMTSLGKPAPTLAEARKLRTGLAIMSTQSHPQRNYNQSESLPRGSNPLGGQSARPTPSPRPSYLSPSGSNAFPGGSVSPSPSPVPTGSSWQNPARSSPSVPSSAQTAPPADGTPIESRFPSLEEIDAQFSATSLYPTSTRMTDRESRFASQPKSASAATSSVSEKVPQLPPRPKPAATGSDDLLRTGIQSAPVTKEPTALESLQKRFDVQPPKGDWKSASFRSDSNDSGSSSLNAPSMLRPKRSSVTMKYALEGSTSAPSTSNESSGRTAAREDKYQRSPKPQPRDWLTGDDDDQGATSIKQQNTRGSAILRDTPAKRASVILPNEFKFPSPSTVQHDTAPSMRPKDLPTPSQEESPTVSRFKSYFPAIDTAAANEAAKKENENEGLTDNWSPIVSKQPSPPRVAPKPQAMRMNQSVSSASSADEYEGPEDLGGLSQSPRKRAGSIKKRKGRQSSVHDLVDLWGGGVKDKGSSPVEPKLTAFSASRTDTTKTPKPRPTSLMPPSSSAGGISNQLSGRGSVSPQRSPIQRDPSPVSPAPPAYEFPKKSADSAPARGRPQSMFIFPAKPQVSEPLPTPSSQPQASPTLAPPAEEEKAKGPVRRTSISNMVQRYEAIGGKVITPQPVPPSPRMRKVSVKTTLPLASGEGATSAPTLQRVKVFPVPDKPEPPPVGPKPTGRDEFRPNRVVPTVGGGVIAGSATATSGAEPIKARTRTMSTGRSLGSAKPLIDIPRSNNATTESAQQGKGAGKTSPIEIKRPNLTASRFGGHAKEPSVAGAHGLPFPKRKPTLALDDAAQQEQQQPANKAETEDLSTSPERPYLGVGRLIDQWQRKAEDTAPGGGGVKRAGLVNGSGR